MRVFLILPRPSKHNTIITVITSIKRKTKISARPIYRKDVKKMKTVKIEIDIPKPLYTILDCIAKRHGIGNVKDILKQELERAISDIDVWTQRTLGLQA